MLNSAGLPKGKAIVKLSGGLTPEYPAPTDADEIKQLLRQVLEAQSAIMMRLDNQAIGINSIGENMQWLVQNVQGIFQMFASPQFMSQMSNMLMGGMGNGGRQDDSTGTPEGTDTGGS